MSHVNEVLLPNNDKPFTVFLVAQEGDFNVRLTKSNAFYFIAGLTTIVMGLFGMIF